MEHFIVSKGLRMEFMLDITHSPTQVNCSVNVCLNVLACYQIKMIL